MLAWLTPWVYLLVIGFLYFVLGSHNPSLRHWAVKQRNGWLSCAILLAALGIASALFWKARWLPIVTWIVCIAAVVGTVVHVRNSQRESEMRDGLPLPPEE